MTDHTQKKADGENGVNSGRTYPARLDLSAWDHRPGDLAPDAYRGRGYREETVLQETNQPSSYEWLSDEEKVALQEWIGRELFPSDEAGPYHSYGLKYIFERLRGGFYVTNGQLKGAMLAAGFEPVDRTELDWAFRYLLSDPQLLDRRDV